MKKKARVGFDFDKIFVNYPQFVPDSVIDRLYKKKGDKLAYRIPGSFEQWIRTLSHYHYFRTPIQQNISILRQIHNKKNVDVFLISSRFGFLKSKTENWLAKYNMHKYFNGIYFNFDNQQPHMFKNTIIQQLDITHFADDDMYTIDFLSRKNPTIQFYWLSKKKKIPLSLASNVTQITKLDDILPTIYNSNHI